MESYGWFWNNTRAISLNFNPFSAVNTLGIGRVSFGFMSSSFFTISAIIVSILYVNLLVQSDTSVSSASPIFKYSPSFYLPFL